MDLPLPETLSYFAGPLRDLLALAASMGDLFLSQSRPFQNSEREPDSLHSFPRWTGPDWERVVTNAATDRC